MKKYRLLRGASLISYGIIIALVSVGAVVAINQVGDSTDETFNEIMSGLDGVDGGSNGWENPQFSGTLYSGSFDDEVHQIDPDTMDQVETYTEHSGMVHALAFDGDYLYSGSFDDEVHQIDPDTMTQVETYTGHSSSVWALAFDGDYLYSGSNDDEVHQIDPDTMTQVETYTGHSGSINALVSGS